jgi:hypothetical protein
MNPSRRHCVRKETDARACRTSFTRRGESAASFATTRRLPRTKKSGATRPSRSRQSTRRTRRRPRHRFMQRRPSGHATSTPRTSSPCTSSASCLVPLPREDDGGPLPPMPAAGARTDKTILLCTVPLISASVSNRDNGRRERRERAPPDVCRSRRANPREHRTGPLPATPYASQHRRPLPRTGHRDVTSPESRFFDATAARGGHLFPVRRRRRTGEGGRSGGPYRCTADGASPKEPTTRPHRPAPRGAPRSGQARVGFFAART